MPKWNSDGRSYTYTLSAALSASQDLSLRSRSPASPASGGSRRITGPLSFTEPAVALLVAGTANTGAEVDAGSPAVCLFSTPVSADVLSTSRITKAE
jgi:hypothetical protein